MSESPDSLLPEDAPAYVVDGLRRQPADLLRDLARWADALADYKEVVEADDDRHDRIVERVADAGYSTDQADYPGVPDRAYLTIKEPRDGYEYAYWQWRSRPDVEAPDQNKGIGPVE